jgi:hypothetical protein
MNLLIITPFICIDINIVPTLDESRYLIRNVSKVWKRARKAIFI